MQANLWGANPSRGLPACPTECRASTDVLSHCLIRARLNASCRQQPTAVSCMELEAEREGGKDERSVPIQGDGVQYYFK